MKCSFSLLVSGIFVAYVLHSIYSIVQIYIPPPCLSSEQQCLKSFLASKPKLQLILCTSAYSELDNVNQLTLVDQWNTLNYSSEEAVFKNISIQIPRRTRQNGTLNIYAFVTEVPRHQSEDWKQSIQKSNTMSASFQLTKFIVPAATAYNLLNDASVDSNKLGTPVTGARPVTHITTKLRLHLMTGLHNLPRKELPVELAYLIRIINSNTYLPPLRFDKFSSRLNHFNELNKSQSEVELELEFTSASIGNIRMASQFEMAMDTLYQFGFSEKDLDEVKSIFSDTNVYLLGVTLFVASVHLLFDFLAFKNDVIYWRQRKSIAGLSSRTILWRCFSQIVVFLYLLEEKSSLLVVIPSGIGALIEVWKVTKAFKLTLKFENMLPKVSFGSATEFEKTTEEYDTESMKYLSYLLYPLCIGGAIYSLLYTPHKSWYSWTIQGLVNGVYAFGFLFMLPQLFVNYRLKSVAQLPWRAFMYKAFNTFIDDLFAFIIPMPTSHRMACFRDDIVFLIYLYQRWLYPIDTNRMEGMDSNGDTVTEDATKTSSADKKTN